MMSREPIAIVGIGCRFPGGASDPESFWQLLCDGVDAIREVPADRWSAAAFYDPIPGRVGKSITRWGGFVDGIERFDPGFFGISPREAALMDPQQRMLLETAAEALDDAGLAASALRGAPVGVFVGISTHDYELLQSTPGERSDIDIYSTTGGVLSIAANRISYCFDLRGPSVAIDTACSSSLIAAHLACQSLWNRDCKVALVGGVNALIAPMPFVAFSRMSMLSPTGRCRAFAASADGFVRAEGAGIVVLKPLAAALADGDRVYAAIRATAANQDGRTNGITVPSRDAQAALVRQACRSAGVPPAAIRYVEAHGTGTPVGDPIEAGALGEALGEGRDGPLACIVGSVKTNIGHLEAGAGIAGLIKLSLVLHHGKIPPNLHFATPNPAIDFRRLKIRIPVALEDLPQEGGEPTLAGINSFGFGGSNAHAVLQAVRPPSPRRSAVSPPRKSRLLVISAQSGEALVAMAKRYGDFLSASTEPSIDDVCRSAGARRTHHAERLAVVGDDRREIAERLARFAEGEAPVEIRTGGPLAEGRSDVAFVFAGQGQQWWAMGRELVRSEPVFRAKLEECDRELARHGRWRLLDELARDERESRLAETAIAQPAIFALQVALAALWDSWGIRPAAVVGHSVGEVAAAHVAGVLTLAAAAHVIFQRGRCMDLAPERGRMLAVQLAAAEAAEVIAPYDGRLALGAINGPASITLAGDGAALEEVAATLAAREVFCRFLQVNYAFHSAQMDPVRDELLRSLGSFERSPARIPMISTVTAGEVIGEELSAEYWWRNVRQTVRFGPATQNLVDRGWRIFLEVGAHPVLGASIGECLRERSRKGVVVASLRRKQPERATLLGSLGSLHLAGVPIDWAGLYPEASATASLPKYAWQREPFWHESPASRIRRLDPAAHPFLAQKLETAEPTWHGWIDKQAMPYLSDHRVQRHLVFPAAGYVEVAGEIAHERFGDGAWKLEDVDFVRALVAPEGEDVPRLEASFDPQSSRFAVSSLLGDDEASRGIHCAGSLRLVDDADRPKSVPLSGIRRRCRERVAPAECYRRFRRVGLEFGPAFRGIVELRRREGEALARVRAPSSIAGDLRRYRIHPAMLDACFQALSATLPEEPGGPRLYLPVHVERLCVYRRPAKRSVWCHAELVRRGGNAIVGDLRITDDSGSVLIAIDGFRCQAVRGAASEDPESWLYESRWEPKPLAGSRALAHVADVKASASAARGVLERRQAGDSSRARFIAVEPTLDRLCRGYVVRALGALGWRPRVGAVFTSDRLAGELGITRRHRHVFERFLVFLREDGILSRARNRWRVRRLPAALDCETIWRSLLAEFPALHPELTLLRRCGEVLARVLRGKADPLAAIAPGGSLLALAELYQDAPSFADYNRAVAAAVAHAVQDVSRVRPARILEVGAGTGGTTAHVLPRLPANTEYLFTDVSPHFFSRAEQKFFGDPRLRCQRLDIERSPSAQGFEPHSFDVVLACDALHATAYLAESLAHVRELVVPGGLLVALEIDRPTRWVDLVFGLTEGWWRLRDHDLRPSHPLLDRVSWGNVLSAAGFDVIDVASDSRAPSRSGQTVLVARAAERPDERAVSSSREPHGWLLLADRAGTGAALADLLRAAGQRVVIVEPGDDWRRHAAAADEIVHLGSLDVATPVRTTTATLDDAERVGCLSAVDLVRSLADSTASGAASRPRLWLVTRGSQAVAGEVSPAQAPLWGLGRVIQNEQRAFRCRMVDLDPRRFAGDRAEAEALAAELLAADPEDEVALRSEARYVNRLVRGSFDAPRAASQVASRYRVEVDSPGSLDGLRVVRRPRQRPAPGQVEIEVRSAALNFRDVMKALGIYPIESDEDLAIGDECAGRIVAVGRGVRDLRVGDAVLALATGCFASHLTLDRDRVARLPKGLSFDEAATIPVVFLTAWYSLMHLGRLQAGEKVLVHAATGGVGLAALQVARLAGAEVFATAGSEEKRDFLRALGVEHVMDSRSLAFADQVLEATGGRGVDLVLNSLAGEAIAKSLATLAPHGRFLEIGKRDIYQDTRVGLRPFRKSLSMFAIDLPQVMRDQPDVTRRCMEEILDGFARKKLRPLPHRTLAVSAIGGAFRAMAKAEHVGKIVVSMADDEVRGQEPADAAPVRFAPQGTHLVSGGLGGFGLAAAEWMVRQGARHLVLAGRSGATTPAARRAVAKLRRQGARVLVAKTDVADERQVDRLFARIRRSMPPLRGIFHAAMVLDDGVLTQLDAERFHRVMAPKVHGAWNLHVRSLGLALDHFVLFSSVSSVVGAPAQANYVAANSFLDALAHHRRGRGLPALAVNWGQLAEVGYVARHEKVESHLNRQGILGIAPEQALGALGRLLAGSAPQVGVVRVDWQRWSSFLPSVATAPRYAAVVQGVASDGGGDAAGIRDVILQAPAEERVGLVTKHLREQIGRVLRTSAAKLDAALPLSELGVDSLMAFELVNRIESQFSLTLPPSKLTAGATIVRLAEVLLEVMTSAPTSSGNGADAGTAGAVPPAMERIVAYHPNGSRTPLFCIHPAGGLANIYGPLVGELPSDLPVYALQSRAVAQGIAEHESIDELAADYATQIVELQPSGAYRLLGFSIGGILALAVADVLERRGARVELLALIDADLSLTTPTTRTDAYVRRHILDMLETLGRELGVVRSLDPEVLESEAADLASRVVAAPAERRARTIVDWLGERGHMPTFSPALLERYFSLFDAHVALVEGFAAPRVQAPILLWHRAAAGNGVSDHVAAWQRCTGSTFEARAVDGNHYDLMYAARARRIALELDEALRAELCPRAIAATSGGLP